MIKHNLPSDWKSSNFGEIFDFEKKSKHKASEGKEKGNYKFFTSSNIQKKFIDGFDFDGDFLVFGTGGSASMHNPSGKFSTSTDCLIAKMNNHQVLTKYVYYYLAANMHLLNAGFKGAGLKHISKKYIQSIEINYPSDIETQKKIVAILEKTEWLKEWRKEADELTDEFLKSTFLEMFGDPVTNPNEWNVKKLNDIILNIEAGWSVNGEQRRRKENEFAVLKISAVTSGFFIPDEHKVITNCENLKKIITPEKGDLLFSRANTHELVGATCIVRNNYPYLLLPDKLWKIKLDEQKISSEYLKFILSHPAIRGEISKHATGSSGSMLNISMSKLKSISIIVPPIELQNKFASIVQQVEQMREHQSQSKQHIDDLFNVLMQKAFKGELM